MTVRDTQMNSRRFELDETRRKLRDLGELKRHIEASLERMGGSVRAVGGAAVSNAGPATGNGVDREATLMRSLDEINRNLAEAEKQLTTGQERLEHEEMASNGYDRVPVAVGSHRGRGQFEHIRIVRAQRGNDG